VILPVDAITTNVEPKIRFSSAAFFNPSGVNDGTSLCVEWQRMPASSSTLRMSRANSGVQSKEGA
jgi:hypothetical protein